LACTLPFALFALYTNALVCGNHRSNTLSASEFFQTFRRTMRNMQSLLSPPLFRFYLLCHFDAVAVHPHGFKIPLSDF
jgi:hypothetical protein